MTDKYKGVVEIEILGEKRGFKFGWAANAMLCKLENAKFSVVQARLASEDPSVVCNFYYAGAIQYCRLFKVEKEPTYEDVANWIDHLSLEQNVEALKIAFAQYVDPNKEAPQTEGQS